LATRACCYLSSSQGINNKQQNEAQPIHAGITFAIAAMIANINPHCIIEHDFILGRDFGES